MNWNCHCPEEYVDDIQVDQVGHVGQSGEWQEYLPG